MTVDLDFSTPDAAHRYFSAACFNHTWDLLDKADRSPADDEEMIQASLASLWHWNQRPDCTDQERSIGTWLAARVFAVLKQPENARRYAQQSLDFAVELAPFYRGYALEALARAEAAANHPQAARQYLEQATQVAAAVSDEQDRQALLADLQTI